MKIYVIGLTIVFLFLFVLVSSNTWEIRQTEKIDEVGNTYLVSKHSLHWDRFFFYIKDTPRRIFTLLTQKVEELFSKLAEK